MFIGHKSSFIRQRCDHIPDPVDDSRHLFKINPISRVEWCVVVGISEYGRVRDHNGWIPLLPERPLVGPSYARQTRRGRDTLGWELRRFAEYARRPPDKIARFGVAHKANEVSAARIEETQQRRILLTTRCVGVEPNRLQGDHG